MQTAFAGLRLAPHALPLARRLANEVLSLPIGPHLSQSDVNATVDAVKRKSR
jgi:dTDP-4-amino-4,6-dideoxygalactose transaminase